MSIFFISQLDTTLEYKKINNQDLNTDIVIGEDNFLIEEKMVITENITNNGNLYIKGNGFELNGGSIINNGNIFFTPSSKDSTKLKKSKEFLIQETISGDSQFTGFFTQESIEDSFLVTVMGPDSSSILWEKDYQVELGIKLESPFYFSDDKGFTAKNKIEIGDALYCNTRFLQTNLYQGWKLILRY